MLPTGVPKVDRHLDLNCSFYTLLFYKEEIKPIFSRCFGQLASEQVEWVKIIHFV